MEPINSNPENNPGNPAAAAAEAATTPTLPTTDTAPAANPVINPAMNTAGIFEPEGQLGATDPITMPEQPKAPDPIEEELKAPLKAAEPVPGSIGSAISVPSEAATNTAAGAAMAAASPVTPATPAIPNVTTPAAPQQTPSVAFNDPATTSTNPMTNPMNNPTAANKSAKKPMNPNTWKLMTIVAGVVIVALVIVLIMEINRH